MSEQQEATQNATQSAESTPALNLSTLSLNKATEFSTSASIAKIAGALAAAQTEIEQPTKGTENTYFSSKYAPLDVIWKAARAALSKNGIAVVQAPSYDIVDIGTPAKPQKVGIVTVVTMLCHSSGEWMRNVYRAVSEKIGPQGAGSALTYIRRYALCAMVMVTPQDEDDDAESASDNKGKGAAQTDRPEASNIEKWSNALKASKTTDELAKAWADIPGDYKPQFEKLKDARKKALVALAAEAAAKAPAEQAAA